MTRSLADDPAISGPVLPAPQAITGRDHRQHHLAQTIYVGSGEGGPPGQAQPAGLISTKIFTTWSRLLRSTRSGHISACQPRSSRITTRRNPPETEVVSAASVNPAPSKSLRGPTTAMR